jgi:hypothetical protein
MPLHVVYGKPKCIFARESVYPSGRSPFATFLAMRDRGGPSMSEMAMLRQKLIDAGFPCGGRIEDRAVIFKLHDYLR